MKTLQTLVFMLIFSLVVNAQETVKIQPFKYELKKSSACWPWPWPCGYKSESITIKTEKDSIKSVSAGSVIEVSNGGYEIIKCKNAQTKIKQSLEFNSDKQKYMQVVKFPDFQLSATIRRGYQYFAILSVIGSTSSKALDRFVIEDNKFVVPDNLEHGEYYLVYSSDIAYLFRYE